MNMASRARSSQPILSTLVEAGVQGWSLWTMAYQSLQSIVWRYSRAIGEDRARAGIAGRQTLCGFSGGIARRPDSAMATAFPPQDLDCPDPNGCMVADTLPVVQNRFIARGRRTLPRVQHKVGLRRTQSRLWGCAFYAYRRPRHHWYPAAEYVFGRNAHRGSSLQTVFHDVHQDSSRTIYERDLRGMLLAHVQVPAIGALGDLRDPILDEMILRRSAIVSSPAEHYPCTRRLAIAALRQSSEPAMQGLIWHSRQAEFAGEAPAEVLVLFGGARYPSDRGK